MLAAQVDDAEHTVFRDDLGVIPGDTRVRDHQIFINLSAHAERTVVEIDNPLFVPLDKNKGGEYSRTGSRRWANNGLEIHAVPAKLLQSR
jgi:hypothetical protein